MNNETDTEKMTRYSFYDFQKSGTSINSVTVEAINFGNFLKTEQYMPPVKTLRVVLDGHNDDVNTNIKGNYLKDKVETVQLCVPLGREEPYRISGALAKWMKELPVKQILLSGDGFSAQSVQDLRKDPELAEKITPVGRLRGA